jgi:plastocyanin
LPGLLAAGVVFTATARAPEHVIVMDGVKFNPAAVTVQRGDSVVWTNKDPFPHTATAKGVFDSREIASGKSWKWTARKAGSYEYVCTLHPGMKGGITVK